MPSAEPEPPRAIVAADEPALAAFLGSIWPEVAWRERFAAQWTRNPFAMGVTRGFLCEARGEIVACFGNIALPYHGPAGDVIGFGATALAVHPAQRGRGLARALVTAWRDSPGGALWINATPNAESARLFAQLGFHALDERSAARRGFVTGSPWSSSYRSMQQRLGAAAHLALPLVWWRAREQTRRRRALAETAKRAQREQGLRVEHLRWDDARLDELWCAERKTPQLQKRRDVASLRWTFASSPRAERNLLLGVVRDRALIAWAAFREEPERRRLRMVDAFGSLSSIEAFAALSDAACAELAPRDLDHVELRCGANLAAAFQALGLRGELLRDAAQWWTREAPHQAPEIGALDGDRILDVLL
jgi:GNAT superfamily N-acetyltransferase